MPFKEASVVDRSTADLLRRIGEAIKASPNRCYVAEVWIQVLKHRVALAHLTGRQFCEGAGLRAGYSVDFTNALKAGVRLEAAGMNPTKLE